MPDVAADVDAELAFESLPIITEAASGEAKPDVQRLARHTFHAAQHAGQPVDVLRPGRGESESTISYEHGRHAMPRGRRSRWVPVELNVVMRMNVDEARGEHEFPPLDLALALFPDSSDSADAFAPDADVGDEGGQSGSIDHPGASDDEIKVHTRSSARVGMTH